MPNTIVGIWAEGDILESLPPSRVPPWKEPRELSSTDGVLSGSVGCRRLFDPHPWAYPSAAPILCPHPTFRPMQTQWVVVSGFCLSFLPPAPTEAKKMGNSKTSSSGLEVVQSGVQAKIPLAHRSGWGAKPPGEWGQRPQPTRKFS